MSTSKPAPGVASGRLQSAAYDENFADRQQSFDKAGAEAAAARCLFCDDAPCITACPTAIDVPRFIGEIQAGMINEAAQTILDQNILGGLCARVCPTDELCEGACVVTTAGNPPIEIARLQRHACDAAMAQDTHPFARATPTGKRVAVVGAGPAGLACAHRLALKGHEVALFDARQKAGGLSEYGIAVYKTAGDFAQKEIAWLTGIGGITITTGKAMGRELTLAALREEHDAVFLAIGLGGVEALRTEGEDKSHVHCAFDFIAQLRQQPDRARIAVGRRVVVIGGGQTALDTAVQAKLLGAEDVTMVYSRDTDGLEAPEAEQHLASSKGVRIVTGAAPLRIIGDDGVEAVEFAKTQEQDGKLVLTEDTFRLRADQVFKALGQRLEGTPEGLELSGRRIAVSGAGRTNLTGVWAGGDCVAGGSDLTVSAVAEGRDAAEDIHFVLTA